MEAEKLVMILREAANVERAHTLPHHGSYTVGKHSYDAVCLLLALHPDPSMELIKAVLFHDVPERYTGDMPATAKWSDGELAKRMHALDNRILNVLGINFVLTADERLWLAAVDRIELLLWSYEQVAQGNMLANAFIGNLASWFKNNKIPTVCQQFVAQYKWSRTPDVIPQ